jgi:hypothetical protein
MVRWGCSVGGGLGLEGRKAVPESHASIAGRLEELRLAVPLLRMTSRPEWARPGVRRPQLRIPRMRRRLDRLSCGVALSTQEECRRKMRKGKLTAE